MLSGEDDLELLADLLSKGGIDGEEMTQDAEEDKVDIGCENNSTNSDSTEVEISENEDDGISNDVEGDARFSETSGASDKTIIYSSTSKTQPCSASKQDTQPCSPSKRRKVTLIKDLEPKVMEKVMKEMNDARKKTYESLEQNQWRRNEKTLNLTNHSSKCREIMSCNLTKGEQKLAGKICDITRSVINKRRHRAWAEKMIIMLGRWEYADEAMSMLKVTPTTADPFLRFCKDNYDVYCKFRDEEQDQDFSKFLDLKHPQSQYVSKRLERMPPLTAAQRRYLLQLSDDKYRTMTGDQVKSFNAATHRQVREKFLVPDNTEHHREFSGALMREVTLHFVKMSEVTNEDIFSQVKVSGVDVVATAIQTFIKNEIRQYGTNDIPDAHSKARLKR